MSIKHYSLDDLLPIVNFHLIGVEGKSFIDTIKKLGYNDLREYLDIEFFGGNIEYGANPENDIINKSASRILTETQTERKKEAREEMISKWDSLTSEQKTNFEIILLKIHKLNFEEGLYRIKDGKLKLEFKMWIVVKMTEYLKIIGDNKILEDFIKYVISVPIIPHINIQQGINQENKLIAGNLHYWKRTPEKLQELYDLLLMGKMISPNPSFFPSFQRVEDKDRVKTEWLTGQRSLFCLMYLLYDKKAVYESENIENISRKLFTVKGRKTNYKSTKSNFQTFLGLAEGKHYLAKKHSEIISLIEKLGLNK